MLRYLGTVRQVVLIHGEALKRGIALVGGVPPATPMWYESLSQIDYN